MVAPVEDKTHACRGSGIVLVGIMCGDEQTGEEEELVRRSCAGAARRFERTRANGGPVLGSCPLSPISEPSPAVLEQS